MMRKSNSTAWEFVPKIGGRWMIDSLVYPLAFPLRLRLTSVLGDVVFDTVDSQQGGQVICSTQFQLKS